MSVDQLQLLPSLPAASERLTGPQVQDALSISRTTLYRLRKQGLPAVKVGGHPRYRLSDVEDWLERREMDVDAKRDTPITADELPPCHWSPATALDPKHRPQSPRRPSSTVRREWWRFPQEAHLLDEDGGRYRRLLASEIASLQGFPKDWGVRAGLGELDLIRGYGNAVPPPLAGLLVGALRDFVPGGLETGVEVCAGFGGLALGSSRAGIRHLALLDFWPRAVEVLKASGPWSAEVAQQADVSTFDWAQFGHSVHLLSGGPPCQPWSSGGQGRGVEDERDLLGLMPEVVATVQPRAFLLENVPGLLMGENAEYAERLVQRLRYPGPDLSYGCVAAVLNAADFGVPQVRRRVFLVGIRGVSSNILHDFFDAVYARRTHSDPRGVIPRGLKPWVTVGEALPNWDTLPTGWRRWLKMTDGSDVQTRNASAPQEALKGPRVQDLAPVLGLNWPSRGGSFRWRDGHWEVVQQALEAEEEYRPLLFDRSHGGTPSVDPWYVAGDPSETLPAVRRVYGRTAQLVYLDAPRLRTDDTTFAAEDQYARLDTWLTVVRGLIRRAVPLLCDEGVLVVLSGSVETPYLELLLNEAMGPTNRVGVIAWEKAYSPRNMPGMTELTATHDNLLVYSRRRSEALAPVELWVPPEDQTDDGDPRGPWKAEHKGANKPDISFETHVPPYDWKVVKGDLPPGFWRLCERSGVLWADANSVAEPGSWAFTIEVRDASGKRARKDLVLEITEEGEPPDSEAPNWFIVRRASDGSVSNGPRSGGRLRVTTVELPNAVIGHEYSAVLVASGGAPFEGTVRPGRRDKVEMREVIGETTSARKVAKANKVNVCDMRHVDGTLIGSHELLDEGITVEMTRFGRYWEYTATTLERECARFNVRFSSQKREAIPAIKMHVRGLAPLNQVSSWTTPSGLERGDPTRIGWTEDAKHELKALKSAGLTTDVPKPVISKPSGLIGRLVALFSREHGVVVDVGSPTAEMAAIATALNRRAIFVEFPSMERQRSKITWPRLVAAARGQHPLPTGALFGNRNDNQPGKKGYLCGISPRSLDPAASACFAEAGQVGLRIRRDPKFARFSYDTYPTGSMGFLDLLCSLEGLVPSADAQAEVFAVSPSGITQAVYFSGREPLSVARVLEARDRLLGSDAPIGARLRVYFHRGLDPAEVDLPSDVEIRRLPYDLAVVGARMRA